jgi:hypothetical protein
MNAIVKATILSGLAIVVASAMPGVRPALGQGKSAPAATSQKKVVWDGERVFPKSFGHVEPKKDNVFQPQTDEVHQGKVALECVIGKPAEEGGQAVARGGWNWHGWWPEDSGDDLTPYTHFVFWMKVEQGKKIERLAVGLESSTRRLRSPMLDVTRYCPTALDGAWHEVAIPVADLVVEGSKFNAKKVWELRTESRTEASQVPYAIYFDDISFERRAGGAAEANPAAATGPATQPSSP